MQMTPLELKNTIYNIIAQHFDVTRIEINGDESLVNAFAADSLDAMELLNDIENSLHIVIPDDEIEVNFLHNATPNSLVKYCAKRVQLVDTPVKPAQTKPNKNILARIFQKSKSRTK